MQHLHSLSCVGIGENIVCDPLRQCGNNSEINIAANHFYQCVKVVFFYKMLVFRLLHFSNPDWQIGVLQIGAPVLGKFVKSGFGDWIIQA